jgi:hypothetical protein
MALVPVLDVLIELMGWERDNFDILTGCCTTDVNTVYKLDTMVLSERVGWVLALGWVGLLVMHF